MGTSRTLLLPPLHKDQALQKRPHREAAAEKGALCLGIPGTINSIPLTLIPKSVAGRLWGSNVKSALTRGVQQGEEQVVPQL